MHLTNVKFQKRIEDHLSGRIARPDFIFYVNTLIQFTLTEIGPHHEKLTEWDFGIYTFSQKQRFSCLDRLRMGPSDERAFRI